MTAATTAHQRPRFTHSQKFFWALLLAAILPWAWLASQNIINFDIVWLCDAMKRILAGHTMSEAAYDPNPPLSLLLYALPVMADQWLHIPLHYAVYAQSLAIVLFAALAMVRIMSAWGTLPKDTIYTVVAAFLLVNTVVTGRDFGERDHLIGAWLVPLALMQMTITFNLPRVRGWGWAALVGGTLAVLLKPHDALLPGILLLHRMVQRKNLSFIKDADFLCLSLGSMIYGVVIYLAFPDYLFSIMPDVIRLYAMYPQWARLYWPITLALGVSALFLMFMTQVPAPQNERRFGFFLAVGTCCCLLSYAAQAKGFSYHLLPVFSFLAPALSLALLCRLKVRYAAIPSMNIAMVCLIIVAFWYQPLNFHQPHHDDYNTLPLPKLLAEHCPKVKPCSFFMFNGDMGIMHETAYYTGITFASRFPTLWFLPPIYNARRALDNEVPSPISKSNTDRLYNKYAAMITQDLSLYKPDVIILIRPKKAANSSFINFMIPYVPFIKEWVNYKKLKSIQLPYWQYYGWPKDHQKIVNYDVFIRQQEN